MQGGTKEPLGAHGGIEEPHEATAPDEPSSFRKASRRKKKFSDYLLVEAAFHLLPTLNNELLL